MYPRTVEIQNDKLAKLLEEKGTLIHEGRNISVQIENVETDMEAVDAEIQELEKAVDLTEFKGDAEKITARYNKVVEEMEAQKKKMFEKMRDSIPPHLPEKYDALKKQKEKLEAERNKIALKVQKYNDKIIPLGRKAMKDSLQDEYEDYNSLELRGVTIIGTIFSHMDDFIKRHKEKQKM